MNPDLETTQWFGPLLDATQAWPHWLQGLLVLAIILAVTLAVHGFVIRMVRRTLLRWRAGLPDRALRRVSGPVRLTLVLLALGIALPVLDDGTWSKQILQRLLTLGVIALIGWVLAAVINTVADVVGRRHRMDVEDNLLARKQQTQIRLARRVGVILVIIITVATMLMTFPGVREYGVSLFASAGVAGLVVGLAARPVLGNLIAGIQIAITQPIRLEDAVVVEGEWGWIEEIRSTYVVVRVWDWRRLVLPISYFIENPFQNWTREGASVLGSVFWQVDYHMPVDRMREKLDELLEESDLWDGQAKVLQVTEAGEKTLTLRGLMSAKNSPTAWDLRCEIREKMIAWLQAEYPEMLPRYRAEISEPLQRVPEPEFQQPRTAAGSPGPGEGEG